MGVMLVACDRASDRPHSGVHRGPAGGALRDPPGGRRDRRAAHDRTPGGGFAARSVPAEEPGPRGLAALQRGDAGRPDPAPRGDRRSARDLRRRVPAHARLRHRHRRHRAAAAAHARDLPPLRAGADREAHRDRGERRLPRPAPAAPARPGRATTTWRAPPPTTTRRRLGGSNRERRSRLARVLRPRAPPSRHGARRSHAAVRERLPHHASRGPRGRARRRAVRRRRSRTGSQLEFEPVAEPAKLARRAHHSLPRPRPLRRARARLPRHGHGDRHASAVVGARRAPRRCP